MSNEFLRHMIGPDVIDSDRMPTPSNYVPPKKVVHIWMNEADDGDPPLCGEANATNHLCPAFGDTLVVLPYLARNCYCRTPVCSFCLLLWEGLPR